MTVRLPVERQEAGPIRHRLKVAGIVAASVVLLGAVVVLPLAATPSELFFWEMAAVQILFATSVNLLLGYANLVSFGQAAFYGFGAYAVAELATSTTWAAPVVLVATMLMSGLLALLVGWLATRVRGVAFTMVTLAVGQALYLIAFQSSTFGGANGLPGIMPAGFGPTAFWYLLSAFVALGMLGYWTITRSPFGQTLQAIREDAKRATFLGVNIRRHHIVAFALAGCGAGLAGGLMTYASGIVTPDALAWTQSGYPIIMALVGGIKVFLGPAVGAVIVTWLLYVLGQVTSSYLLYIGIVLAIVLVLAPNGLLLLVSRAFGRRRL